MHDLEVAGSLLIVMALSGAEGDVWILYKQTDKQSIKYLRCAHRVASLVHCMRFKKRNLEKVIKTEIQRTREMQNTVSK